MRGRTHASPPEPSGPGWLRSRLVRQPADRKRSLWRVGTPVVVLLCGALFVVSATNSDGTDLRPGRYTDLASLVKDEANGSGIGKTSGRGRGGRVVLIRVGAGALK